MLSKSFDSLALVVLEFDMQAVFDADLHLYRIVHVRIGTKGMYNELEFFHDVAESPDDRHSQKVPQPHVGARVALEGLLDVCKLEIVGGVVRQFARPSELLHQARELVMVAAVIVELDLTDELNLDTLMLQFAGLPQADRYLERRKELNGVLDSLRGAARRRFTFPETVSPSR